MLIKFEVEIELSVIRLFFILEWQKKVAYIIHVERRLAKDSHDFEYGSADFEIMLNDGNEAVGDDGNMNLNTYRILGLSPKSLNLEMLLDPLEEQLHLPSISIKKGNVLCFEVEVVRIVDKTSMQFRSIVDNPSDGSRILLPVFHLGKADTLVFKDIISSIKHAFSVNNLVGSFTLLPDDEECSKHIDMIESGEVKVTSVKHIACQWLV